MSKSGSKLDPGYRFHRAATSGLLPSSGRSYGGRSRGARQQVGSSNDGLNHQNGLPS